MISRKSLIEFTSKFSFDYSMAAYTYILNSFHIVSYNWKTKLPMLLNSHKNINQILIFAL